METENNRYSKAGSDPKTIDLAAEEIRDIPQSEAEGTDEEPRATPEIDERSEAVSEPVKEEPVPEAAAPFAGKARGSNLSLLAASLIGGVVALGGAAGLQFWGLLPNLGNDEKLQVAVNNISTEVETLNGKFTALSGEKPQVDFSPVEGRIAAIETRLKDVPKANGLSVDADTRIAVLGKELSDLALKLEAARKDADEAKAQLVMRLETLEKKSNQPGDDVQVAVAIASAGLKAAIDRGGPFEPELQTLAGIDPQNAAVSELKAYAETGVASRSELVRSFPATADEMLSAVHKEDPNESFTDRLLNSALSSIKVRPVGNVEGEGPDAIAARIETRLADGDLKGAQAEWDKLPAEAKKAGESFKNELDARIKVEDLVSSTLQRAMRATETKG